MEIHLAKTKREKDEVYRLRHHIYVEERNEKHGNNGSGNNNNGRLYDELDKNSRLLYAIDNGRIVGTLRVSWGAETEFTDSLVRLYDLDRFLPFVPREKIAITSRFAVLSDYRRSIVPFRLIAETAKFFAQHEVNIAFADTQPNLLDLYLRLGFRTYPHKPHNDPAVGITIPLVFVMEDYAYLSKIKSPLLPYGKEKVFNQQLADSLSPMLTPLMENLKKPNVEECAETFGLLYKEISEVSIFQDMAQEEIDQIVNRSYVIKCKRGDHIIKANVEDRTMYVVLKGAVEIKMDGDIVNVIPQGGVIGEIAFLLNSKRTADVYASTEEVEILVLNDSILYKLTKSNSQISAQFFRNLSKILSIRLLNSNFSLR